MNNGVNSCGLTKKLLISKVKITAWLTLLEYEVQMLAGWRNQYWLTLQQLIFDSKCEAQICCAVISLCLINDFI